MGFLLVINFQKEEKPFKIAVLIVSLKNSSIKTEFSGVHCARSCAKSVVDYMKRLGLVVITFNVNSLKSN